MEMGTRNHSMLKLGTKLSEQRICCGHISIVMWFVSSPVLPLHPSRLAVPRSIDQRGKYNVQKPRYPFNVTSALAVLLAKRRIIVTITPTKTKAS